VSGTLIANRINPDDELIIEKDVTIEGNLTVEGSIPLPVGTILMYDGTNWIDNITMAGWYACTGNNGTPDLQDRFIMGSTVSGTINGANSITIGENNLPFHSHTIDHQHNDGQHDHNVSGRGLMRITLAGENKTADGVNSSGSGYEPDVTATPSSMETEKTHNHTLNNAITGDDEFINEPIDNRPQYYSVIYIKKIH